MQKSILYERSMTLPHIRGHFHRPRLDKLLNGLTDRQLIIVTAGAGCGKTHTVSAFLNNSPARVIWFQLSELDNYLVRFWEEFVYIMMFLNKETAVRLEQIGFPETFAKFDQFLHILAKEIYAMEQIIIVFDDFHLIHDESIIHFIERLISAKLENFCIIINSRTKLNLNLASMGTSNLIGYITEDDLNFTPDEIEQYLEQYSIYLTGRDLKKVQAFTEGWPLALYLVRLSIKKGYIILNDPIAGAIPLIFEMIESELFSEYTPEVKNLLIKASLLNSFPKGLIKVLTAGYSETILEFIDNNMFIYYNPYTECYSFHHLFLEFLKEKQEYLTQHEITAAYLNAANWCAANDLKIDALDYYDKCSHYDEILNIMVNYGNATFPKSTADFFIGITNKFPKEFMEKNPIIHIIRAGLFLNNADIQYATEELTRTQKELVDLPLTKDNKVILGNIYCLLGMINMGICNYNFKELFKKASEYLPEGGIIGSTGKSINTRYAIMLSSPAPGELKKMEKAMFYAIPYASKAMNGYGQGLDYLASAEAAYFTGDMKKAAKNAYEAIYRAREKQVSDVASSGYFLLMRIEASNGNYEGVVSYLEQLRTYVGGLEDKLNFNGMLDVAEGWFYVTMGCTERIANWITDDTDDVLAPYIMGMERSVKSRYLLKNEKYYELLAWLGQSEKSLRQNNMWFVLLDNLIYKSIAYHHIQDEEQTVTSLQEAYNIAHGNNIVMQFAELGKDMRVVIYNVSRSERNTIPGVWLDDISTKAATYDKHINNIKSQYDQALGFSAKASIKLTKSEKETLRYLCQGLTNIEIATARYISISAVKKALNNIYIKLEAANRAEAVRIAIQMGLYK